MSKIQLIKISEIENLLKEKDYKIKTLDIKNFKTSIWNPKDELEKLFALTMINVDIEVIGSFLWVTGETKPYKEHLKELGMKWGRKKEAWYLSPKGYKRYGKKDYKMDEIRGMYGSETIKRKNKKKKQIA